MVDLDDFPPMPSDLPKRSFGLFAVELKEPEFKLDSHFLEPYKRRTPDWGPIGYVIYKRCVDVNTPVLCADLQWRPAGELKPGDRLLAFDDDQHIQDGELRHVRLGSVVHNSVEKAETYGVELEDGTVLYATPDHRWLVKMADSRMVWRETKDLGASSKGGDVFLPRPFGPVWSPDRTYEAGYLAAAFDGEHGGALRCDPEDLVRVVRVFPAGEREIAVLSTDVGTHFTGGFPSHNTYARTKEDGTSEEWWETIQRVVEGVYQIQQRHCAHANVSWRPRKAQRSAQEMYRIFFDMLALPPGRGLWMMGTEFIRNHGSAALQNCGFATTANIGTDFADPFCWLMDMSMLGVGIGGDVDGAGKVVIQKPVQSSRTLTIPDTREGWIWALRTTLLAFVGQSKLPSWDYSQIRKYGEAIKGFGGVAAGPGPLQQLIEVDIPSVLMPLVDRKITATAIVDLFNFVGKCVVSGNVRRSAEIMLGDPDDPEFLALKDPKIHAAELRDRRWASNNSVRCFKGMNYRQMADLIARNGEPGGIWLDSIRGYGRMIDPRNDRDYRAIGVNPCVAGDTEILTRTGYRRIDSLVGKATDIWNGHQWSTVTPKITGHNQPMLNVRLSDGTSLRCTTAHTWILDGGRKGSTRLQADQLLPGMRLAKSEMPLVEGGSDMEHAYIHGFFCGDGQVGEGGSKGALLYGEKMDLFPNAGPMDAYNRRWIGFPRSIPDKFVVPQNASVRSRLEWLAGLLDADGTVLQNPNSVCIQLSSVEKDFLLKVRKMLTTLGVQAKVQGAREEGSYPLPDGHGGLKEYHCQKSWRLLINASDTWKLVRAGLPCRRLQVPALEPQRDARRFVSIETIEPAGMEATVYCFNEPINHSGTFEGIITAQCVEQSLEDRELCCLVETFPARHATYEEYRRTLKFAYLYAKTVVLLPTHSQVTNEVMGRNRRIGTSQSGIIQSMAKIGRREHLRWSDLGYQYIQQLDELYSEWLSVRRSIKTTSVKPSGTVSKLCGATSGIHYPPARWYIQRIRFGVGTPLLDLLVKAGYPTEPDVATPNTMVVEFPCFEKDFLKGENDVSIWEQISNAAQMQRYWADNQVSCTVKFDGSNPEKAADEIASVLELFEDQLKGISFLPQEHGYAQAPWEPITEDEYNLRVQQLRPLGQLHAASNEEVERFCDSDICVIPKGGVQ